MERDKIKDIKYFKEYIIKRKNQITGLKAGLSMEKLILTEEK